MSEVVNREVTIINKLGLHARAAAKFVTLASQYQSDIRLLRDAREVNAKSIMGVMMLAAGRGTALHIQATGEDAEEAVLQLERLVQERFGEAE
jgi:phosphocarrier protein HPr